MRVPKRKGEILRSTKIQTDHYLTKEAIERLKRQLDRLEKERPEAVAEVQRTAEMGDFSENAAYQMAKGKLRRINNKILVVQEKLKAAIVIEASGTDQVQIGSRVTVEVDGSETTFEIVGSQESDPSNGRISYKAPLGVKLMNSRVGDVFEFGPAALTYRIVSIA